jgi:hypothetical protein
MPPRSEFEFVVKRLAIGYCEISSAQVWEILDSDLRHVASLFTLLIMKCFLIKYIV